MTWRAKSATKTPPYSLYIPDQAWRSLCVTSLRDNRVEGLRGMMPLAVAEYSTRRSWAAVAAASSSVPCRLARECRLDQECAGGSPADAGDDARERVDERVD